MCRAESEKKNIIGVLWVGIFCMHILKVSSEKYPGKQNMKQNERVFFKLGWKRVNKVFLQRVDPSHATQC